MKKTIYFHIGTVKTGTTFIQKFCHENADFLAENNLAYPHITPPQLHLPRYANAAFLWDPTSFEPAKEHLNQLKQSRILISEEGLMGSPSQINLPVFDDFEKKVILYLRPAADVITAWATEKCKPYNAAIEVIDDQQGLFSFEKGLLRMMHDYIICMDKVVSVLSNLNDDDVFVRPFERSQYKGGSVLHDFVEIFDVKLPFYESAAFNKSPSRKYCDISHMVWRILRDLGAPDFYNYSVVERVYRECRSGDDRPALETLPDATMEKLCLRLQYFETHFSSRYLNGRPLFKERFPKAYGLKRDAYSPPDLYEVERLTRIAINGELG
ncbi:hypothetical protein C8J35_1582 [Rhizobium sp. PP-F2F-G38]|nr:hypothetical protein C8J35_1582 [Rhizobium sp. PP-F2F-G38]